MIEDFESFETFEEVKASIDAAHSTFSNSSDFAMTSEATLDYIKTLYNGMTAITRISRIEIQKRNFLLGNK